MTAVLFLSKGQTNRNHFDEIVLMAIYEMEKVGKIGSIRNDSLLRNADTSLEKNIPEGVEYV